MPPSHYETANVYLASFLICQGLPLAGWRRVSERRVQYRFDANDKLHECLRLWWGNAVADDGAAPFAKLSIQTIRRRFLCRRSLCASPPPSRRDGGGRGSLPLGLTCSKEARRERLEPTSGFEPETSSLPRKCSAD